MILNLIWKLHLTLTLSLSLGLSYPFGTCVHGILSLHATIFKTNDRANKRICLFDALHSSIETYVIRAKETVARANRVQINIVF